MTDDGLSDERRARIVRQAREKTGIDASMIERLAGEYRGQQR
jgi:hypothetical protein